MGEDGLAAGQYAMVLVFATSMITYTALEGARLRVLMRDNYDMAQRPSASKHSEPLSLSFPSLYAFFKDMSFLGLILLLAFMCENYPIHPQGGKTWDRDMYWFLCLLLLLWSIGTMKKGKSTDILNRDQTEEWKGWMQFMFLMYHYYHAEEVYNAIRIMITCYVWMTGFGNFSFFYIKQDFGIVRMLQMLWRLNFLVTLLCLSQGNTYILYYICPLHTFYFFLVYTTMRILPQRNHGKWDVRFKLLAAAGIIYLIWDCFDGRLFSLFFSPILSTTPVIGANSGSLWEWYFRTSLDHWSTLFGMVFALNFPLATRLLNRTEELPLPRQALIKLSAGLVIGGALVWWSSTAFMLPKQEYNLTNAYLGWIPLLAYIYFRNLTPSMRQWYSGGLHEIGKITLETYLMQHHIWLTSNAKTLLILLPGYPKINMLAATLLFIFVSKQLYHITMSLRGMILPDDRRRCLLGAATTAAALILAYLTGWLLRAVYVGVTGAILLSLALSIATLAYLHRRLNIWNGGCPSASGSLHGHATTPATTFPSESTKAVAVTTAVITLFIVLVAMPFQSPPPPPPPSTPAPPATTAGPTHLTATSSLSPAKCLPLINKGAWQVEEDCDAGDAAFCGSLTWRWAPEATAACHFHRLGQAEVAGMLRGRHVAMVGDSVTRQLYWAMLASAGHPSRDAHNGTLGKHRDLHYDEPNGGWRADFYWRPFAEDVQGQLDRWLSPPDNKAAATPPDVVVVGMGLWDALHVRDVAAFEPRAAAVADQLRRLGGEGKGKDPFRAWLLPTTVVSERLTSADKLEHMTEPQVHPYREAVRHAAAAGGGGVVVEAVLDGAALTAGVEGRSHDGVHYDDATYEVMAQVLANALATAAPSSASNHGRRELKAGVPREIDGTMSFVGHGAMVLVVVFLMLFTFDSYAGAFKLAVHLLSDLRVTWEEAYEPLLSRIHRPAPTVSSSLPVRLAAGVGGGGSGARYTPVPQQDIELVADSPSGGGGDS